MLSTIAPYLLLLAALVPGIMSSGPSFLMVARTAVSQSRRAGLAASFGMGLGGWFYATLAVLGLQALLIKLPALYIALKVIGGLYLLYLAYTIWCRADEKPEWKNEQAEGAPGNLQVFKMGLATQLSNPKIVLHYASVFAALLPPYNGWQVVVLLPLIIFTLEGSWYAIVAYALSSNAPRKAYLNAKRWVDRIAGGFIGLIAVKLLWEAKETNLPT